MAADRETAETIAVYDRLVDDWVSKRSPDQRVMDWVGRFGSVGSVDFGCGPGWYLDALGVDAVGLDLSASMTRFARDSGSGPGSGSGSGPLRPVVRADLCALPFRSGAVPAGLAMRSLVHLDRRDVPLALRDLHRVLADGANVLFGVQGGDADRLQFADDDVPGRWFSQWPEQLWLDVLRLSGFDVATHDSVGSAYSDRHFFYTHVVKARTVPSTLARGLTLLLVGVNPSPTSADTGVPFGRKGNRFWPGLLASGLAVDDRDPAALLARGIGMTDFSKRVTVRADELSAAEVSEGWDRLARVVAWLQPAAVAVLGISTYRIAAGDKRARLGWQEQRLGGRPLYVMPNPSGLNAHTNVEDMAAHFRAAVAGPAHK